MKIYHANSIQEVNNSKSLICVCDNAQVIYMHQLNVNYNQQLLMKSENYAWDFALEDDYSHYMKMIGPHNM